jgi:hypothetical protein
MDSVGDLERVARLFSRHLRAENKRRAMISGRSTRPQATPMFLVARRAFTRRGRCQGGVTDGADGG